MIALMIKLERLLGIVKVIVTLNNILSRMAIPILMIGLALIPVRSLIQPRLVKLCRQMIV